MALIPTLPLVRYHPVFGRVEFKTLEAAAKAMVPEHDWSETPEDADRKRTQREADMVVHNSLRVMLDAMANAPQHKDMLKDKWDAAESDDGSAVDQHDTVIHSVQHTELVAKPAEAAILTPEELDERDAETQRRDDEARAAREERDANTQHVVLDTDTEHTESSGGGTSE